MRNIFTLLALLVFGTILSKNHAQTYSIYPTPQKVVETGEAIELTQQINVICESGIGEVTRNRMKEVLEEAGYTIAFSTNPSQTNTNLYIGINGSDGAADHYAVENNLPLAVFDTGDNKFDPYLLQINDLHPHGDIVVLGNFTPLPRSNKFWSKPTATRSVKLLSKIIHTLNIGESWKDSTDTPTRWKTVSVFLNFVNDSK